MPVISTANGIVVVREELVPVSGCTDYRCECVSKKVRVHARQYFIWIVGFTNKKKCIGINLIPVTVSH
jgi:hypothetical protein